MTSAQYTVADFTAWEAVLTSPRYRKVHVALVLFGLVTSIALHFATFAALLRNPEDLAASLGLSVLTQAHFLIMTVYAGVTLRLKWSTAFAAMAGAAALPIAVYAFAFGSAPLQIEAVRLLVQESLVVAAGVLVALLLERIVRLREIEEKLALRLNAAETQLNARMSEIMRLKTMVETTDRQLVGLNALMRKKLNALYDDMREAVHREETHLDLQPPTPLRDRYRAFLRETAQVIEGDKTQGNVSG